MNQQNVDWTIYLNDEERKIHEEIIAWEENPGKNFKNLQSVFQPVVNGIKSLSPDIVGSLQSTITEILKVLRDYSHLTINKFSILDKISGIENEDSLTIDEIKHLSIRSLDAAAKECMKFNITAASLEGGITGTAGFNGLLLDLPLLYGLLFRSIQEVAICYGYEIDTPEEKLHILKILELGHIPDEVSRRNTIGELHALQIAIRGGITLNQIEKTIIYKGLQALSEKIGLFMIRRKLVLAMMIIGGISGAALNYLMAKEISEAAFHTYRMRALMDRAEERRPRPSTEEPI